MYILHLWFAGGGGLSKSWYLCINCADCICFNKNIREIRASLVSLKPSSYELRPGNSGRSICLVHTIPPSVQYCLQTDIQTVSQLPTVFSAPCPDSFILYTGESGKSWKVYFQRKLYILHLLRQKHILRNICRQGKPFYSRGPQETFF